MVMSALLTYWASLATPSDPAPKQSKLQAAPSKAFLVPHALLCKETLYQFDGIGRMYDLTNCVYHSDFLDHHFIQHCFYHSHFISYTTQLIFINIHTTTRKKENSRSCFIKRSFLLIQV